MVEVYCLNVISCFMLWSILGILIIELYIFCEQVCFYVDDTEL